MEEEPIGSHKFPIEGPDTSGVEVTKLFKEEDEKMVKEFQEAEGIDGAQDVLSRYLAEGLYSEETPLGKVLEILEKTKLKLIEDGSGDDLDNGATHA